jgi:hypothetical protein
VSRGFSWNESQIEFIALLRRQAAAVRGDDQLDIDRAQSDAFGVNIRQ